MKIEDFLMDRFTELEAAIRMANAMNQMPSAMYDAINNSIAHNRSIVEWHEQWPVLVSIPPDLELEGPSSDGFDFNTLTYRLTQKMQWMTQRAFTERFGTEAPATPLLLQMANRYKDHPDFQEEWRL